MTLPDFMDYKDKFTQRAFVEKISHVAKRAGAKMVYTALILYYTLESDKFTALPVMVISGHFHFLMPCPLEKNQTGVSVAESLKRSSADGISSSSNHFFNLS